MKQNTLVLDASVAIKWLSREKEEQLEQAELLLTSIVEGTIHALSVDFFLLELANVLLKGKKLPEEKIHDAIDLVVNLPIEIIPLTPSLVYSAVAIAEKYDLTVYNSIYLALAKVRVTKVITADKTVGAIPRLATYLGNFS